MNVEKLYKYNLRAVIIITLFLGGLNVLTNQYAAAGALLGFLMLLMVVCGILASRISLTARILLVVIGKSAMTFLNLFMKDTVYESFPAFLAVVILTQIYFNRKIIVIQGITLTAILVTYTALNYEILFEKHEPMAMAICIATLILGVIFSYMIAGLNNSFVKTADDKTKSAEEAQARAEMANATKTKFLATMSHEIRTPMNAIIGIAQINLQKSGLPEEYASAFGKINTSGNNLLGIINDILDMSKIETGKMELIPVEYDIPSLVYDTVQLNVVRIGSKEIEFILDIDENLPSRMIGDELRLKQIMNNLLSNAIKYTEKGHVKLTVTYAMCGEDMFLRFIVEDTGQGMRKEDSERLFSEYSRFNIEANRTIEGTGIGLSIVKNLTDLMNGTIAVESEYGKGSTFTVSVKQTAVACSVIGPELSERIRTFSFVVDKQTSNMQIIREPMPYGKVLIVDDVETNLYVAEGLMSPYQLTIETAISGFKAIEKVERGGAYDIIFMDHMMPLMDGVETAKKLRASGYGGVIVALTANALVGNDKMFKENGFDGFIAKPIDVRHLNTVLNKFVRDKHSRRDAIHGVRATAEPPDAHGVPAAAPTDAMYGVPTMAEIPPKLREVFCRDAGKAVAALRETSANGDVKLFTTTAHAMKSALANIGEREMSELALRLENAGLNGDLEYIAAGTEEFVRKLEALAESFSPEAAEETGDIQEDTEALIAQLSIIQTACGDYDDTAAYAALDWLKEKPWGKRTSDTLEAICDTLFLHSDFDGAAAMAAAYLAFCRGDPIHPPGATGLPSQ
ncbi:MAG: ATP-binding protein [Oscillospiraceae bacterium]|nr:ATP-binding protein [Oscillospiraceae bacterium]